MPNRPRVKRKAPIKLRSAASKPAGRVTKRLSKLGTKKRPAITRLDELRDQLAAEVARLIEETAFALAAHQLSDPARMKEQEEQPTCLELALASGFVGADDDLPADLSSNPTHLGGLGRGPATD